MSGFFRLHQRKDLVLFKDSDQLKIGVIVAVQSTNYLVRPVGIRSHEVVTEAFEVSEESILQKVGELDFDTVHENDESFGFLNWAEEDLL
jgi:hypothetical protein